MCLENGLLLRRPAESGEPLVKGDWVNMAVSKGRLRKRATQAFLVVFFRPCMSTWKLRTSACSPTVRPGRLERMRWSSSGKQTLIFVHILARVPVLVESQKWSLQQSIYIIMCGFRTDIPYFLDYWSHYYTWFDWSCDLYSGVIYVLKYIR